MSGSPWHSPQADFLQWGCFWSQDVLLLGLQILREVAGVLDPDMILKSKAGYSDYEQENQPGQEVLGHMEDMQSKVRASKTQVQWVQHKMKTAKQMALNAPFWDEWKN